MIRLTEIGIEYIGKMPSRDCSSVDLEHLETFEINIEKKTDAPTSSAVEWPGSLFVTLPDFFVAAWLLDSRPYKLAHAASRSYLQALRKVADQLQHLNWSLKHAIRLGGLV